MQKALLKEKEKKEERVEEERTVDLTSIRPRGLD
jgi:hypothetical protein